MIEKMEDPTFWPTLAKTGKSLPGYEFDCFREAKG